MGSPRVLKLADQIKVIVAEMLERRIKDPRLGFVTITDVRLTGDSRDATVFYTVLGLGGGAGEYGRSASLGHRVDPVSGRQAARPEVHPDDRVRPRRRARERPADRRPARPGQVGRRAGGRAGRRRGVRGRGRPVQARR